MKILVYLENQKNTLPKSSLCAIRAALEIKSKQAYEKAVGIVLGQEGAETAAKEAAKYGLDEVLYISSPELEPYLAVPSADALTKAANEEGANFVLAASTSRGKDLMPRVAQALDAGQASDILEVLENNSFKRPMYAGNVVAKVEINSDKKAGTVRTTAFDPAESTSSEAPVRALNITPENNNLQEFVSFDTVESERPELTEAEVVVSGGRALKSAENFDQYMLPLADALGAAIGASRAAVDSGYAPNDWQVGQTGKVVAPSLYIAIGISGAIQHLAGMKDSKVIVAINTDPEAPIFEVADYGLVADLYETVPQLVEEVKKAKSA